MASEAKGRAFDSRRAHHFPIVFRSVSHLVWLAAFVCATGRAASPTELELTTADGARHAQIFTVGDGPRRTLIVLHGASGTGEQTARGTGFAEAAAKYGFNAVFPDGLHREWNDGRVDGPKARAGVDDIGFLTALVERLVADRIAKADAIYLAGISNGGMMSFTMACKAPRLFAGLGTVIANLPEGIEPCAFKPMPVVLVNGTADPMVPYGGGAVGLSKGRGRVLGVEATATTFAAVDGCDGRDETVTPAASATASTDRLAVTRIDWRRCAPGTSLTLYRVEGGGHNVYGRSALFFGALGPSTTRFVAADVIVDAFARAEAARR